MQIYSFNNLHQSLGETPQLCHCDISMSKLLIMEMLMCIQNVVLLLMCFYSGSVLERSKLRLPSITQWFSQPIT